MDRRVSKATNRDVVEYTILDDTEVEEDDEESDPYGSVGIGPGVSLGGVRPSYSRPAQSSSANSPIASNRRKGKEPMQASTSGQSALRNDADTYWEVTSKPPPDFVKPEYFSKEVTRKLLGVTDIQLEKITEAIDQVVDDPVYYTINLHNCGDVLKRQWCVDITSHLKEALDDRTLDILEASNRALTGYVLFRHAISRKERRSRQARDSFGNIARKQQRINIFGTKDSSQSHDELSPALRSIAAEHRRNSRGITSGRHNEHPSPFGGAGGSTSMLSNGSQAGTTPLIDRIRSKRSATSATRHSVPNSPIVVLDDDTEDDPNILTENDELEPNSGPAAAVADEDEREPMPVNSQPVTSHQSGGGWEKKFMQRMIAIGVWFLLFSTWYRMFFQKGEQKTTDDSLEPAKKRS
ncbi:hypothetical protein TWF696_008622 [Orbilia brochopaga]|uniref:Uncharacterized protein n=1 Tax=Orbilia brochopaga TaxID=3140254 RepID=A0AAV9UKZ7_9PEZI